MNDEARPQQQRRRSRRRTEGGGGPRRPPARTGFAPRRRNDYAGGQYSSIFTGPFPTEADEGQALNLPELQAKSVDELRELASEHEIEGAEGMEHSDLVLKLLDVVPLAPTQPHVTNGQPGIAEGILEIVDEGFGFLRRTASCRRTTTSTSSQPDPPLRPAHRRPRHRADPRRRRTRRSTSACCASRPSTAWTQRSPSAARTSTPSRRLPRRDVRPRDRPKNLTQRLINLSPDRQGPARPDRLAAQGGQDHRPQAHRQRHLRQPPRRPPDGALIGERPEEVTDMQRSRQWRGRLLDLRRAGRGPHPRRRDGARARQAAGRERPRRRDPARLDHAAGPRLQPGRAAIAAARCPAASTRSPSTRRSASSAPPARSRTAAA